MGGLAQWRVSDSGLSQHAEPALGAFYVRGCLQGAVLKGHDPEALLRSAQLDPSLYTAPDARINGQQFQRLILAVRRALNDEYMGLMKVPAKLEMRYLVGRAAVRCKTLGLALHKMAGMVNAVRSDIEMRVEMPDDDHAAVSFQNSGFEPGTDPHVLAWVSLFSLYKFQCWLIGQRIKLSEVGFHQGCPAGAIDYSKFFDCPTVFSQDRSRIVFDRRHLSAPVIRTEVELRERDFAYGHQDWFEIPGRSRSVAAQVEQLLYDLYTRRNGATNLDVIGDILCVSPRTLSRKLQKENVSFQELKDRVRRSIAQKLLTTTDMSVAAIADAVGFSEPADFTRAYVSWTGRTPSDYRCQARQASAVAAPR